MNAPATFVKVMEDPFHAELGKFIWIYIDDIFIFSEGFEKHIEHLKHACKKLNKHKFYANPKKSVFFAAKLDILGHKIDDEGIHPAAGKIRIIMDWTRKITRTSCRSSMELLIISRSSCPMLRRLLPHSQSSP